MKIAVVTNSYKRSSELVTRSLSQSLSQSPPVQQLIFVDQNPVPLQLPDDVTLDSRLTRVQTTESCVSSARNLIPIADDVDWLIFCDDDGYLENGYIAEFIRLTQQNPNIDIFAGAIVREDNLDFYTPRQAVGGDLGKFRNAKLLMGSNFAVKSKTFRELGKFDEAFGAGSYWGSGEETDFAWKANFNKIPSKYSPTLRVIHKPPYHEGFHLSVKKAYRYGRGKGALVSKWLLRGHFLVLIEAMEMTIIPIVQTAKALITLKWNYIPIYAAALAGRFIGLLEYPFVSNRNRP
jgi:hypothetical protein